MKKTLLSALKHGSGILLTIFALLCSCQGVWGYNNGDVVYYDNSRTKWSNVYFAVGKVNSQCGASKSESTCNYLMSNVPGTYLYKYTVPDNDWWSNAGEYAFLYNTSSWAYSSTETVGSRIKGVGDGYGTWPEKCSFTSGEIYQSKSTTSKYASTVDLYKLESTTKSYSTTYRVTILAPTNATITVAYTDESGVSRNFTSGYRDVRLTCKLTITPSAGSVTVYGDYRVINGEYVVDGNLTICIVPTVTTASEPDPNGSTSATLKGSYTTSGASTPVAKGIAYKEGVSGEYVYLADGTSSAGTISVTPTGLSPLTTYYYKAYVEPVSGEKVFGSEYSFTTLCRDEIEVDGPADGSMTICAGAGDALSVTASGASDYTYQWYYNSTASTEGATSIDGANSASYSPTISGTKYYYCVVGADTYCDKTSSFSGAITYDSSKTSPVITASATSVTNYIPVTLTVTGADVNTWNVSGGNTSDRYLYKESGKGAMFKGTVGSGSDVAYTVTGTASNGCSSAVSITVSSNTHHCR